MQFIRIFSVLFGMLLLLSCTTTHSALDQAKRDYGKKNYQQSFTESLHLANQHNPAAQYAVGYMYYYGLGTLKDEDIGRLWIRKAASQHYGPAILALKSITAPANAQYTPLESTNTP